VGDGVVAPAAETRLEDNLNAPSYLSRRPHPVYAIRIGADRSGDKIGVYAYAQEHAREWVGPLVAVETAERLVRNYEVNPQVRELLNNVEVFVLPSVNPDGGHYSFHDFTGQRKNMTNYCPTTGNSDPAARNSWGVDLNRNYSVGTYFDGYVGGSGSCTSGNFSGPFEFSEPESKNVEWIADTFPNIKFSMNIHSSGNFFMWPPGAYTPERVTLPRPTLGEESYFWGAAGRVVGAIRNHRNLTVEPGQTGPVADVLYSAAGNSGDELWYENGIFGWDFEIGTSFQPAWPEAHNVAMEFSNGLYELVKIAQDYAADGTPPNSSIEQRPTADGKVKIRFFADEPATVYYRLDGRRPTYDNATMYVGAGDREGGQSIRLEQTTNVTWFAVDAAGNVERNYKPEPGSVSNLYRRQTVIVTPARVNSMRRRAP
jgi:Zinc carboxypeptidase/Chitobiase/beta-hexosaminidase C-terminal domain